MFRFFVRIFNTIKYGNKPKMLMLKVTNKCNRQCLYCSDPKDGKELDIALVKKAIDQAKKVGIKFVNFTGGETFLYKDLQEGVLYAKRNGFKIAVATNGFFIEENINFLKYIDSFQLSLDGSKDVNDFLRGKGAYEAFVKSISFLKRYDKNFFLSAVSVVTDENLEGYKHVLDLAKEYGFRCCFEPVTRTYSYGYPKVKLSTSNRVKVFKELQKLKENNPELKKLFGNSDTTLKYYSTEYEKKPFICSGFHYFIFIDTDGSILPCYNCTEKTNWNLQDTNFADIIKNRHRWECKTCESIFLLETTMNRL